MLVEALLFDLDGTLIDSLEDIAQSVHHLQKISGRRLSPRREIARFIGDGVEKLVQRAVRPRSPRELRKALKIYKTHYAAHALDHTRAFPGVARTLRHFRHKPMAVITNKLTPASKKILRALGLLRYFRVVIGGDLVTRKKPHPEGIRLALRRLKIPNPQRAMMIGDSAQDVLSGRAAGVLTCAIFSNIGDRRRLKASKPDFTVRSMPKLMRIVA